MEQRNHIKYKKEEKEFVSEEEEQLFGLRREDHRSIVVNNFEIHSNYIKTFHGGLSDL